MSKPIFWNDFALLIDGGYSWMLRGRSRTLGINDIFPIGRGIAKPRSMSSFTSF
jgi:hypothetical protein